MGMVSNIVRKYIVRTPLTCTSCGGPRAADNRLVSGGVYICERCSASATADVRAETPALIVRTCSFCGKTQSGLPLGSDPTRAICVECVALVEQILAEDRPSRPAV